MTTELLHLPEVWKDGKVPELTKEQQDYLDEGYDRQEDEEYDRLEEEELNEETEAQAELKKDDPETRFEK